MAGDQAQEKADQKDSGSRENLSRDAELAEPSSNNAASTDSAGRNRQNQRFVGEGKLPSFDLFMNSESSVPKNKNKADLTPNRSREPERKTNRSTESEFPEFKQQGGGFDFSAKSPEVRSMANDRKEGSASKTKSNDISMQPKHAKVEDIAEQMDKDKGKYTEPTYDDIFKDTRLVAMGGNPELMGKGTGHEEELLKAIDQSKDKPTHVAIELIPARLKSSLEEYKLGKDKYKKDFGVDFDKDKQPTDLKQLEDWQKLKGIRDKISTGIRDFIKDSGLPEQEKLAEKLSDFVDDVHKRGIHVLAIEPGDKLQVRKNKDDKVIDRDEAFAEAIRDVLKDQDAKVMLFIGESHTERRDPEFPHKTVVGLLDKESPLSIRFAGGLSLDTAAELEEEIRKVKEKGEDAPPPERAWEQLAAKISLAAEKAGLDGRRFLIPVKTESDGSRMADWIIHLPKRTKK